MGLRSWVDSLLGFFPYLGIEVCNNVDGSLSFNNFRRIDLQLHWCPGKQILTLLRSGYYVRNLQEKQRAIESLPRPWEYIGSKSKSECGTDRQQESVQSNDSRRNEAGESREKTKEIAGVCSQCRSMSQGATVAPECSPSSDTLVWRPSPLPGEHSCMAEAQRTELLR
jgi:hypothetical protein